MVDTAIVVLPDDTTVAAMAAERLAAAITGAVTARGRAVVALSGGRTPLAMFRLLAAPPYSGTLPWAQTHIFWADERLVPPDDPGSNYYHAHDLLLRHVPLPPENIHRPQGELASEAAVAGYAAQLAQLAGSHTSPWPRFDSILLGLGSDGHTASLFPGSPVVSAAPVLSAHATYEDRPAERLTLSSAVINDAREVLFLVTGAGKAEAVAETLRGALDPIHRPAQRIQPRDGEVVWLLDEAAAAGLRA